MDLHKEIKLSDLFKRGSKEKEPKAEKPPKEEKPSKEKRRKEPKPKNEKRPKTAVVAAHEAPPLPDIPLMRAFNLLPREEVKQAKEGASSPVPRVLVALFGVLVIAALAAFYLMAGADVTTKKSQAEDLRAELAGYEAAADDDPLDDKSAGLAAERAGRRAALATALSGRLAWDRILRELALVIPENVALTALVATDPAAGGTAPVTPSPTGPPLTFSIEGETEEPD